MTRRKKEPSYRPIVLIENASLAQVIAVRARQWELPGIEPLKVPARHYPTSDMAAHLFGYVSEITEPQLARPEYAGVESGSIVGQAGVEQAYNRLLMGSEGNRAVIVNSLGREIEEVATRRRWRGTTRSRLRGRKRAAEGGSASGFAAPRVLDPRNGGCSPGEPTSTTQQFRDRHRTRDLDELLADSSAAEESCAAGIYYRDQSQDCGRQASVEEGVITPEFACTRGGRRSTAYSVLEAGRPRTVEMRSEEQSCKVFSTVGNMLGVIGLHSGRRASGRGEKRSELRNGQGTRASTEWKRQG